METMATTTHQAVSENKDVVEVPNNNTTESLEQIPEGKKVIRVLVQG